MNTFEIVRLIGDAPVELLTAIETSLLTRMAFFANKEGKQINPGVKELVRQTKFSRDSVIRSIASLVKKNILIDLSKRVRGSHDVSCYDINVNLLQKVRISEKDYNKSYYNKLKTTVKKIENDTSSSSCELPESSSCELLDKHEKSNRLVADSYLSSSCELPESSSCQLPCPYIQYIEPILPITIVKSDADSTSLIFENELSKISKKKKSWNLEIEEVFKYWQEVMNHPAAKFDVQRKRKIEKALSEHGYTVEQLKKSIDGAKKSPWHMGENPEGKIYDSIDLIFRNPGKIETFISIFDTEMAPRNKNVSTALKTTFVEKNKAMVNMLDDIESKFFPEFADNPIQTNLKENLLTFNREHQVNDRE